MKNKLKNILMISFLAIAGIFGVSSALINKEVQEAPVVEKADAAGTLQHFFLDCTGFGDYDSEESVCVNSWNGSSQVYAEAVKVADNYWYAVLDTTGCSGYKWYRCRAGSGSNPDPDHDLWNVTAWCGNLSNNYASISGNWSTWSTSFSGSTSGCEESYEVASTSPSTSTKRIWVNPKDNFYSANARAGLRVFNGDTPYKTYILGGSAQYVNLTHESKTQYFFYVDIPVGYGCQLVRLHNAFDFVWTYSGNLTDTTTQFTFSWDAAASTSVGGLDNDDNYTVDYAKKVLDGFSTCESSSVNGYGAYNSINSNVLSKLSSAELTTLKAATFGSSFGTRTYGEKISRMENKGSLPKSAIRDFSPLSLFGDDENGLTTVIIIVSSSIALLSVTALSILVIKKRKNKEE